jgi:Arc/MetJ-type ribon-helix-helix transcriptional regulator
MGSNRRRVLHSVPQLPPIHQIDYAAPSLTLASRTYGIMYGMKKTTLYLPDELKADLERVAETAGKSEAELIREAIRALLEARRPPRPALPLFDSGDATLAERVDEELKAGFGKH